MNQGTLYIIATPIGNLEDITLRAINILKNDIDIVYCEDTRQTSKLLMRYDIKLPKISLHSHSSEKKIMSLIDTLKQGKNAAYLTDSGTPGISDPGNKIVNFVRSNNIRIVPVPGASALATILSVSGFSGKTVVFKGFLSKKKNKRIKELESLLGIEGIVIIYESPYRIKKTLTDINLLFPNKDIIIGREMTKIYEEFITGKIEEIISNIEQIKEKGEFTIAINNKT